MDHGADRTDWYAEVLGWYENYHQNTKGPFYDGLSATLSAMSLEDFYREAIDFIIDNKGEL
jgi:hypothetical protein